MRKRWILGGFLTIVLALTACGTSRTERGLSGGAIGAGLGAAAGEVLGNSPGKGAIVGGAAGAATGVLTADDHDGDSARSQDRSYDDEDCYYDRTHRRYYCRD
jgi:osmotically inducible lipoprotein OsmB